MHVIEHSEVYALAFDPYLRIELSAGAANTENACCSIAFGGALDVFSIDSRKNVADVCYAVVVWVAIDVVDHSVGPHAMNPKPGKSMG